MKESTCTIKALVSVSGPGFSSTTPALISPELDQIEFGDCAYSVADYLENSGKSYVTFEKSISDQIARHVYAGEIDGIRWYIRHEDFGLRYLTESCHLFQALKNAGWAITRADSTKSDDLDALAAAQAVDGLDEAHATIVHPTHGRAVLFLVFGNSPGELLADYTDKPALSEVIEEVSDEFEGFTHDLTSKI